MVLGALIGYAMFVRTPRTIRIGLTQLRLSASQCHIFADGSKALNAALGYGFSALREENRTQLKIKHRSDEGAMRQLRKFYIFWTYAQGCGEGATFPTNSSFRPS